MSEVPTALSLGQGQCQHVLEAEALRSARLRRGPVSEGAGGRGVVMK